eukprot:TRINITY_DN28248_c0_g1_i1.p1 TRINITY_DN28248_c0_g1~~TRINITY_DN28248_c0_g1_i1.p1  ORF type:complete len:131 (+),score=23.87 TRINITY_DN28248_c0_g1_i1:218-610(+)
MGQAESRENLPQGPQNSAAVSGNAISSFSSPFEDLLAGATDENAADDFEPLAKKIEKALECPCVAELRNGPCGGAFTDSFICFMKSAAEEKGSDCVFPFLALQKCIEEHPDAFTKYDLDKNVGDGEETGK